MLGGDFFTCILYIDEGRPIRPPKFLTIVVQKLNRALGYTENKKKWKKGETLQKSAHGKCRDRGSIQGQSSY